MRIARVALILLLAFALAGAAAGPPPYRRADWGGWQGNCPDARTKVLMRDARPERTVGTPERSGTPPAPAYVFRDGGCVLAWVRIEDPYTGAILNDPQRVHVDHVLAIEEAHRAGGWRWSREKKGEFFNWSFNHLAVGASANESKGSRPPPAWHPRPEFLCRYVEIRATVRAAWRLAPPGEAEARFMRETLAGCHPLGPGH